MAKQNLRVKKVLLLGSGALKIGEAGEFDYSGSQAAKAFKEEGVSTILINPNIATIQTSSNLVDTVYFLPLTPNFVKKIIKRERPDGIVLGFGGQTALNCGLELEKKGIFKKYNVDILGTPIASIKTTEDRLLFREKIERLGYKVPKSITCNNIKEVRKLQRKVTYPVIVRSGFSLGGLGSGVANTYKQLENIAKKALCLAHQILVEEYLQHWKEIEYEIVRDKYDNAIAVCNMENFDPMGIHTGESIVIAPSQTLTNFEYHFLRQTAISIVRSLGIVGECNIQYALNPENGDYRIIELNARLSRSSALASKATGYPLAYIAAKLALGQALSDIPNQVTKATKAFFEPALDYVVVKIPRWDFFKFDDKDGLLGSEMQSVGEVMGIGRSFAEAFQKAIRSLNLDYSGIISDNLDPKRTDQNSGKIVFKNLSPTPSRPYNISYNIFYGQKIADIQKETGIDFWFLEKIQSIVDFYKNMLKASKKDKYPIKNDLLSAKKMGFSDSQIAQIYHNTSKNIRDLRKKFNIIPKVCQIDTLAAEYPARTNYLYLSYHRDSNDMISSKGKKVGVIGGGPYQIGSSVEFDWCAVNSILTAKNMGWETIMINCNPETVSTDYDISDRLYFEELTRERIADIADFENCPFIASVGGQVPNTLASKLEKENIKLLGNSGRTIDRVEDREKFSALLDDLEVIQPLWKRLKSKEEALSFANDIGFPVLIRPSYVLSGSAMFVAYSETLLEKYLKREEAKVSSEHPVVISKYIRGAKEIDFDAVADNGKIVISAISEHIEHSGVHSGDATLVLPSFSLTQETKTEIEKIAEKISLKLKINGPFNIQFLVNDYSRSQLELLVIEANLRASRSFPFVSKVTGVNFIQKATRILLGQEVEPFSIKQLPYTAVKVPHFSFTRLRNVDPVLRVEMASTGEVACFGEDIFEAYLKALLSTGITLPRKNVLISLGGEEGKMKLLAGVRTLKELGFSLFATEGTAQFLKRNKIPVKSVYKVHDKKSPNVVDLINNKRVDLVINLSDRIDLGVRELVRETTDGFLIRRAAVNANIQLFTKATIANLFIKALKKCSIDKLSIKSWREYINMINF